MLKRNFFIQIIITLIIFTFLTNCSKTKKVTDKNGFSYETVEGDPLNARIYTLDNGLKVYMTVYKDAPRIQAYIAVRAGSKNDPHDATGLAHYLEHMLFKGTSKFGTLDFEKEKKEINKIIDLYEVYRQTEDSLKRKTIYHKIDSISYIASGYAIANEYDKMLNSIGAKGTNAHTWFEETVYQENIPSNQLQTWADIESERYREPVLRLFHTELETVYEEKNRGLDNDGRKMYEALLSGVFQKHTYGTQTTLGTIEHLKNPSIKRVIEYYKTYYVPNNMAVCLSGDFDPDEAIRIIDHEFGTFQTKPIPKFIPPVEEPITEPLIKEVIGPDAENMYLAFRFPGAGSKEADLLRMVDMILANSEAGLIDLNINQQQKARYAFSNPMLLKDYSIHLLGAKPRSGQKLEDLTKLLLSQIDLIKKGEFPDWLLKAVINDLKLSRIKKFESNTGRASTFYKAFILGIDWQDETEALERLAKISKQDIIDFANKSYHDNYVVVYKRTGEDENIKKIKKPEITPIQVNRDNQSDFVKEILDKAKEVKDIQPVFIDYKKDIGHISLRKDLPMLYKENSENGLFKLYYIFEMGKNSNKKLGMALSYLSYLGTDKLTPAEVRQEFYKIGCSFDVRAGSEQVWVSLKGLQEHFDKSLTLFEQLLANAQPNGKALDNLKKDVLKNRSDTKLNKGAILWSAMNSYGTYGIKSPFTNILTKEELMALTQEELINIITSLNNYKHRVLYYGPASAAQISDPLLKGHRIPDILEPLPTAESFKQLATDNNKVFVVDYDMKQAEILMLHKGELYNKNNAAASRLYNEYYGGSMSSVVFQELRESKALAYSVFSSYRTPSRKNLAHYLLSYIGTQADKLPEALKGMNGLLNNFVRSEKSLTESRNSIIKKIQTERITKSSILFNYLNAEKHGLDYDIRKDIYEQVPSLTLDDIHGFHSKYVKNKKFTYLVLGKKKSLDINALKKHGKVRFLSLEDIFGY
ncbi:insulinase family protein [bacterium]|nr:insulinase family protein [bacterium]